MSDSAIRDGFFGDPPTRVVERNRDGDRLLVVVVDKIVVAVIVLRVVAPADSGDQFCLQSDIAVQKMQRSKMRSECTQEQAMW